VTPQHMRSVLALAATVSILYGCDSASVSPIAAPEQAISASEQVTFAKKAPPAVVIDAAHAELSFDNAEDETIGFNATVGFSHRYSNILTVGSQVIDAVVTVDDVQNIETYSPNDPNDAITNQLGFLDSYTDLYATNDLNPTSPKWIILRQRNVYQNGRIPLSRLRIEFFLGNTATPVVLQNFSINSIDIDFMQYVQMTGVMDVTVRSSSPLSIVQIANGTYRAVETANFGSTNDDRDFWVQFNFAAANTILIESGQFRSQGAVFYFEFKKANWGEDETTTISSPPLATFWQGNGLASSNPFRVETEICGIENGAPVDGPYLLWILTARRATAAVISINGTQYDMTQRGAGSFRYVQAGSVRPRVVFATHNGTMGNLVISHGCP
jgi:hypothetical protein